VAGSLRVNGDAIPVQRLTRAITALAPSAGGIDGADVHAEQGVACGHSAAPLSPAAVGLPVT
jgi:hypothetical protein